MGGTMDSKIKRIDGYYSIEQAFENAKDGAVKMVCIAIDEQGTSQVWGGCEVGHTLTNADALWAIEMARLYATGVDH